MENFVPHSASSVVASASRCRNGTQSCDGGAHVGLRARLEFGGADRRVLELDRHWAL